MARKRKPRLGEIEKGDTIQITDHDAEKISEPKFTVTVTDVRPHLNHQSIRILETEFQEFTVRLKLFMSNRPRGAEMVIYNSKGIRIEAETSATYSILD